MTDVQVPGRMTEDERAAWLLGRSDADTAHIHSTAYDTPFHLTASSVPAVGTNGGEPSLAAAYHDGYAVRAQDLADGSADTDGEG